jgi:hypothetical protein
MKTHKFYMQPEDLRDLLNPVVRLALNDGTLPVLNAVLLEGHGRTITATATDRFRAGIARHTLPEQWNDEKNPPAGTWSALVPLAAVKAILSTFKPKARTNPGTARLELRVRTGQANSRPNTLIVTGLTYAGYHTTTEFDTLNGQYPAVQTIVRDACAVTETDAGTIYGLNPALLGDFQHAAGGRFLETMVMHPPAPGKRHGAIGISIGENFAGVIMQRRTMGATGRVGEWDVAPPASGWVADLFPPAATKAA